MPSLETLCLLCTSVLLLRELLFRYFLMVETCQKRCKSGGNSFVEAVEANQPVANVAKKLARVFFFFFFEGMARVFFFLRQLWGESNVQFFFFEGKKRMLFTFLRQMRWFEYKVLCTSA